MFSLELDLSFIIHHLNYTIICFSPFKVKAILDSSTLQKKIVAKALLCILWASCKALQVGTTHSCYQEGTRVLLGRLRMYLLSFHTLFLQLENEFGGKSEKKKENTTNKIYGFQPRDKCTLFLRSNGINNCLLKAIFECY